MVNALRNRAEEVGRGLSHPMTSGLMRNAADYIARLESERDKAKSSAELPRAEGQPVTQDGPLGGFAALGQAAVELDLLLTQFQMEVEETEDTEGDAQDYHAEQVLKLKRQIIERYTPRTGLFNSLLDALAAKPQDAWTAQEVSQLFMFACGASRMIADKATASSIVSVEKSREIFREAFAHISMHLDFNHGESDVGYMPRNEWFEHASVLDAIEEERRLISSHVGEPK